MIHKTALESQKIVLSPLSLHDLKCRMMDSLHAIDDPKTRLSTFRTIYMEEAGNRGEDEEDFVAFYIAPNGLTEVFLEELDRAPASEFRDHILLDIINVMFESASISFCDEEALERATPLLEKISTPAIKDQARASCIEMEVECNWMPVAREIGNEKELADLIQGVQEEYSELSTPNIHCRLLTKLAVMMVEDGNVKYGIALALRIDDPYQQFLALVDIAMRIQDDEKREDVTTLLKKAGDLVPSIPSEYHRLDSYKEHIGDLVRLDCEFGLHDEMWMIYDGISNAHERITALRAIMRLMNEKKWTTAMRQAIIHCADHFQTLVLGEKTCCMSALVSEIQNYKIDLDARAMVTALEEEIQNETHKLRRLDASLFLAPCYFYLGNIPGTVQLLQRVDSQVKTLQDTDMYYRLRKENMRMKCQLEL